MKRFSSLLLVISMLVACLFVASNANSEASAAEPVCTVQLLNVVCVQAGVQVLNQPLAIPTVRVTLPPVTVPGPTRTATVTVTRVPSPVRVTQTVTAPAAPGATKTITVPGSVTTKTVGPTAGPTRLPRATETVTASGAPGATVTTTVTATPRQPSPPSVTLDPGGDGLIPRNQPPAVVAGVGVGILIALAVLILLGMYAGYYLGYKDSDKAEAKFFRALLNKE